MKISNHLNHRNHFNHSSDCDGFSLIELVFAMMFLTIIILGVVSLQTSNLAMLNGQKNQIQAHFLAIQGVQIVKGLGKSAITCGDPARCFKGIVEGGSYSLSNLPEVPNPTGTTVTVGNQEFQRKIQIISDNTNLPNAYKIRSIVEWTDSTGPHSMRDPVTDEIINSHVETDLIVF